MCGIVVATSEAECVRMLDVIKHRGTTSTIKQVHDDLWFGFRRLAIQDVEHPLAEQPLVDAVGNATMFNGEIYNYKRLRAAFEAADHGRETYTSAPGSPHVGEIETEVQVMHESVRRLRGDVNRVLDGYYAFASLKHTRFDDDPKLLFGRDIFGVMPLYYTDRPFSIASERKALHSACHKLEAPPGLVNFYNLRTRKFYTTDAPADFFSLHMQSMDIMHLTRLFCDAVKVRIEHSQVPVSIALSGGLDSNLVLAAANYQGLLHRICEAVTVSLVGDASEDVQIASEVCAHYGLKHRVVNVTEEMLRRDYELMLWHLEDPDYNPIKYGGAIRNWFVAKETDATVILCGEGADELGAGYPPHDKVFGIDLEYKCLSTLRSMRAINLDRVNKCGMAHTKEFRVPFLDRSLATYAMSCTKRKGKRWFRTMASIIGVHRSVLARESKYGLEESKAWSLVAELDKERRLKGAIVHD